jgi:PAS domain S-box-containing protein
MRISGLVEMITFGPAKVYFPSKRVPISNMLNYTSDCVLVIDRNQKIAMVNNSFLEFINSEREQIIGQSINYTFLPVINEEKNITSEIKDAIDGKKINKEMILQKNKEEIHFKIKIIPTTFEDGKNGAAIILKNVTQQKLAEKALRYSEQNLKNLLGKFEGK